LLGRGEFADALEHGEGDLKFLNGEFGEDGFCEYLLDAGLLGVPDIASEKP
jgi:hypothetical protein